MLPLVSRFFVEAFVEMVFSFFSDELRDLNGSEGRAGRCGFQCCDQKTSDAECQAVEPGNDIRHDRGIHPGNDQFYRKVRVVLYGDCCIRPAGQILVEGFTYDRR